MNRCKLFQIAVMIGLIATSASMATAAEINKSFLRGIAIEGYDPVGYFLENKARKGNSDYSYRWKDATWHFVSQSNRNLFVADPVRYAPRYGGHCANGMSEGHKINGNPEIWRMIDGKLYFFYARQGRDRWSSNTDQWIQDADRNWERLKEE